MSSSLDATLTQDTINLKTLDQQIVKLVLEWNFEELFKSIQDFIDLRKKIKKDLIEYPTAKIHNQVAQEILRTVGRGRRWDGDGY